MKNILIPTDFSENAWNAIKYGTALFGNSKCTFYLLHVDAIMPYTGAETNILVSPEILEKAILKESETKLEKLLKRVKSLPSNTNHIFKTSAVHSFFTDSIKKHVKEKNIDIIIMGTKGASGLKKVAMGSNTGDVITKVQCAVLAVPEDAKYDSPKEIAFPTDYNLSYDINVLDGLKELALVHSSVIKFLYISKKGEELSQEQIKNQKYLDDYFANVEHSFHQVTGQKLESAVQCFTESRDIDMIVMVAKNLNFLQRILFRPAVEEISYHIKIPFLVLHEYNSSK